MESADGYFPGFAWAVPTSFTAPLASCRFEQGDTLYDTMRGYEEWSEALKHVHYGLQIKSPARSLGRPGNADEGAVFADNWKSTVIFDLIDFKTSTKQEVQTTQGQLYTLLWRGDLSVLDPNRYVPVALTAQEASKLAKQAAPRVKEKLAAGMAKPNVFVMVYDPTSTIAEAKYQSVRERLNQEFQTVEGLFWPQDIGIPSTGPFQELTVADARPLVPTMRFVGFSIDLGGSARIGDALKEVLYKPSKTKVSAKERFRLEAHGSFVPWSNTGHGEVQTTSFKHGPRFYRYRVHMPRLAKAPPELGDLLQSMRVDCPNHFFQNPPFCSKLKLELPINVRRDRLNKVTDLAGASFSERHYKDDHENVQTYFIDRDPGTLAVEVPVWMTWEELEPYRKHIHEEGVLTGHIDLLRFEDGLVEVWDYKPGAFEERHAASQVLFYAVMLACRTGLPLDQFRCGYFDPSDAFLFDAQESARAVLAN